MTLPGESSLYAWDPGSGGVHWHRIAEPLRVAGKLGVPVASGQVLDDSILETCDTVLVHMLHDERNSEAWQKLSDLQTHRLIYDIDDAMWAPDAMAGFRDYYTPDVIERVWDNIRRAHVVTTPSPHIADVISDNFNGNVWLVPNTVPERIFAYVRHEKPFQIGYQGSPHHYEDENGDLAPSICAALLAFCRDRWPWRLHFYGPDALPGWPAEYVTSSPWVPMGHNYYKSLKMSIGLGPVKDTQFNRGKSGLRAIEYAALGIVGAFSDHEIYRPWVEDGQTGVLVPSGQSWYDVLMSMAKDPVWLMATSAKARRKAREWTTEKQFPRWLEAWNSV